MNRSLLLLLVAAPFVSICLAEAPRALSPGEFPRDTRLGPLKDLGGYFPFTPPASREAWAARAEAVRQQVHIALGIWPAPARTPLNAVIHSRIEQDDYTVENVYFESMPGLFVTGNLYRPKGKPGPHPAVLAPHGHWAEARFALLSDKELKKELETGGERLANGGRSKFQALGSQLARMGCVAFHYDMLGYCDSQQISFEVAHKFAKQRPEMNSPTAWGLYSPPAESRLQSVAGLQTWNSMRALDFLTALPDVDPKRLACTGASGGGTQTFLLAAVDPRLTVAFPAVMVSTAMQGGCTCENACLLRTGTGNIELAGLFAPKPLGMTTASDWTKEMPAKGFPELQRLYALLGAPEAVRLWHMPHFPHNYNTPTREGIYAWFNQHFGLGLREDQLVEREYPVLTREQLTVWNVEHPQPRGGPDFERDLLRWWDADAQAQLNETPAEFRRVAHPAWKTIIGRMAEGAGTVKLQPAKAGAAATAAEERLAPALGLLRNETFGEEVPAAIFRAKKPSAPV
ncbi:MAG: acetylxylan esterase, partial [Verrucomicrobiota bacterium]|nr:acetylxylan esterase [Verrucomicrobiota bacterium]